MTVRARSDEGMGTATGSEVIAAIGGEVIAGEVIATAIAGPVSP